MVCSILTGGVVCGNDITSAVATVVLTITTIKPVVTSTRQIVTTCQATVGETITVNPPLPPWSLTLSTTHALTSPTITTTPALSTTANVSPLPQTYSSSTSITIAPSVVATEILVVIEDKDGNAYTTATLTLPIATTTHASQIAGTPLTFVVHQEQGSGWNTWSDAERGGLIAGCILAFLILLSLIVCWVMKRRQTWIAHDWSVNGHPGYIAGHPTYDHTAYSTGSPWVRGGDGTRAENHRLFKRWFAWHRKE